MNKKQTDINAVEYISSVNQFAEKNNTDKPKQQTAIEWLFDNVYMAHSELSEKLKQAKEMEKCQHRNTWIESHIEQIPMHFEKYFEKTYGGGEQ